MSFAVLPPFLLHALFPTFPPLWFILLMGLILGVGLAAFARKRRGAALMTLAAGRTMPRSEPKPERSLATSPLARRIAEIREVLGDEILGVPWTVPGYALLFVLAGALLSVFVPPFAIAVLPGYIALWAIVLDSGVGSGSGWGAGVVVMVLLVGFSWLFWTGAAMFGWHLLRIVRNDPVPDQRVRLNLGKRPGS